MARPQRSIYVRTGGDYVIPPWAWYWSKKTLEAQAERRRVRRAKLAQLWLWLTGGGPLVP